jgi:EpsI family protein
VPRVAPLRGFVTMQARTLTRRCAIGATLIGAAVAGTALRPTQLLAEQRPQLDLEAAIPAQFGDWRKSGDVVPVQADPEALAKLDRIYSQVLSRTYVDKANHRVMLSIAYGGDQRNDRMQVHRPEYCYAAQGFEVRPVGDDRLATDLGSIPVRRLLAQRSARREPITYWITVGDHTARPGLERKLAQLRFGLTGVVPDGMLVRVSSLESDTPSGYALHDRFVRDLLGSLSPVARTRLLGSL